MRARIEEWLDEHGGGDQHYGSESGAIAGASLAGGEAYNAGASQHDDAGSRDARGSSMPDARGGDADDPPRDHPSAEVDELLMQMSIDQEGQVCDIVTCRHGS
jgi:hypothetical protein